MLINFLIDLLTRIIDDAGKGIAFLVIIVFLWSSTMLIVANVFFTRFKGK